MIVRKLTSLKIFRVKRERFCTLDTQKTSQDEAMTTKLNNLLRLNLLNLKKLNILNGMKVLKCILNLKKVLKKYKVPKKYVEEQPRLQQQGWKS